MEENAKIIVRKINPEIDLPLIYSTWRNALWFGEERDESLADQFYSLATKQIKKKLADPAVTVRAACFLDDPTMLAGYSVMRGTCIEFVYIKSDYRRIGIATLLCKGFTSARRPGTRIGKSLVETKKIPIQENDHAQKEDSSSAER